MAVTVPAELMSVLEATEQPAILLSPSYEILASNLAYRKAFVDRPEGRKCHEVSHRYPSPCEEHGESCPLRQAGITGHACRVLHVHHTRTGPQHVDVTLTPIKDGSGRITCYLETMREVRSASATSRRDGMVGRSPPFLAALELVRRAAPSDVPLLLLGESGTGKELMARAIHDESSVAAGPFVPVACSGLAESLFESELFGHERGSFTGAGQRKIGLVETAAGGTLFLDEIGDVPLSMQVKLLRLLESRQFRRVGGTQPLRAEFRLVCATHRDLKQMVADGTFREDLFYRISAFPVLLPPLRARGDDVLLLARSFLSGTRRQLSVASEDALRKHAFPGNIRELKNVIQRAVLLADGRHIGPQHLRLSSDDAIERVPARPVDRPLVPLDEAERSYLRWASSLPLERRELAEKLGISEADAVPEAGAPLRIGGTPLAWALPHTPGRSPMSATLEPRDSTLDRLDALDRRLDRLERSVDRLIGLLEQAPDTIAMVADTADDFAAKAAARGVDVDQRVRALTDAVERLTEPKTLESLLKLAESAEGLDTAVLFASKLDDHIAMAADTFDAWAVAQANKGIDIDKRISSLTIAFEAFTEPAVVEALTRLVQHSDTLFETGILADDTVTALGNIGAALPLAIRETPKPLGLWGLMTAFNKPEVQRAAGLGIALATHVGAALNQPSNLLQKNH